MESEFEVESELTVQTLETPILSTVLEQRRTRAAALLIALRPQQWAKNLLLFVPVLLAHELDDAARVAQAGLAFLAFCACASAIYIINDLLDLEADRRHPKKRHRPFASAALPVAVGPPVVVALLAVGFCLAALTLPPMFVTALAVYLVLTVSYSFWLKRKAIVDVLLLAGLYTLRILAGGFATGIVVSEWLMAFSVFLFTSLAFAKRYSELARLEEESIRSAKGRGYVVGDLGLIESLGPTSGYMAVLVFALYINSDAMKRVYVDSFALWLVAGLLLYWISRVWLLAKRRQLDEDPLVFAVTDRVSLMCGALAAGLVLLAAWVG